MAIDFILATAPANLVQVRNFLIARGIVKEVTNEDGSKSLVGERGGFEYTQIPNPIMTNLGDPNAVPPVPPTYSTLKVFLVRLSHETEEDEVAGDVTPDADNFTKAKLVKWVKANGTQMDLTSVNGFTVSVWRVSVNGVFVYLSNDIGRVGVWQ